MSFKALKRLAGMVALTVMFETLALAGDGPTSMSRPGGPGVPPPEAVAACKGQHEGAAVEFLTPNGELIHGTCKQLGGVLAAVPAGDIDEKGGPPAEAIGACQDQQEGATVEVPAPSGEKVKGTCKDVDGRMMAVPDVGPGGDRKGDQPSKPDNE
jgi:hypothetical protein